jgi:DHA2 family multidrug resistance protein
MTANQAAASPPASPPAPYTGAALALLTFVLAMANLMEVLDLTIANVAIPTITGDLAVAPNQGAWVITSYAVANAITVAMTGWFAQRFGQVRLYAFMIACFTTASLLCALATSLPMLVTFRVLQGAAAGFMVPLSQALLMNSFPPQKRAMGLAVWAMTITVAPIIGPILGGWITDNYHWSWIFLINLPVGIFAATATWVLLRDRETATRKLPVDGVGMALLVLWVGALQILLDKGNELDWFRSDFIVALGITGLVGFLLFLAWELTEAHPVVDLGLFRFHNFRSGAVTLSLGYALFFASIVILPLWLQTQLGYTSQWAGYAVAPGGVFAVLLAPFVGRAIANRRDPRLLATIGFAVFAAVAFWRAAFTSSVDFAAIALPQLLQGVGIAFFFTPLISINLGGIPAARIANATGLQNFLRMMMGSFGASIAISAWDNRHQLHHSQLAEQVTAYSWQTREYLDKLAGAGLPTDQAYAQIDRLMNGEAYALATNDIFWAVGWMFLLLTALIWTTRPPFGAQAAAH